MLDNDLLRVEVATNMMRVGEDEGEGESSQLKSERETSELHLDLATVFPKL